MRRYGMPAAYVVMLLITLPIVLFPDVSDWWFYLWLAALAALRSWSSGRERPAAASR